MPRQRLKTLTAADIINKIKTMYIQPITEGQYFHIYNRGVNGENIFKEKKNYYYFLKQYKFYCSDALETMAYCLLKNHFHLLVYIRENVEIPRRDGKGMFRINASKQLGHFFNSYTQSINKAYKRTGPLFEPPFERKLVDDKSYIMSMIYYCNNNAVRHEFAADIRDWEFSSYHAVITNDSTIVAFDKVIERFGSISRFEEAHRNFTVQEDLGKYIIDF
jgi:REP element-mobilizing transposase RayT